MIDLEHELSRAVRFRREAQGRVTGLPKPWVGYGLATVAWFGADRRLYEPQPGGAMVFVVPVVESGDLIDLCAIDARDDHFATRMGYAHGLGLDVIEGGRMGTVEPRLVGTAMAWLCDPRNAVFLFDLSAVAVAFDNVPVIACETLELADRVAAYLPPSLRGRAQVA